MNTKIDDDLIKTFEAYWFANASRPMTTIEAATMFVENTNTKVDASDLADAWLSIPS